MVRISCHYRRGFSRLQPRTFPAWAMEKMARDGGEETRVKGGAAAEEKEVGEVKEKEKEKEGKERKEKEKEG